jgi:hypothetical protein
LPLMAAASRERAEEKGNGRFETRVNAALIGRLKRGGKEGKAAGHDGNHGGAGPGEAEEGEKKKGRGRGRC